MKSNYTCKQVAEIMDVKIGTVQGWIRRKELPAILIGHTYYVEPQALEDFIEQRRTVRPAEKVQAV